MMIDKFQQQARSLKSQAYSLYFAFKDARTPWYAKLIAILVFAYALSPIDLIPDFIPVLGYLDDLLIIPAGVALVIKLIPAGVWEDARQSAEQVPGGMKGIRILGTVMICMVWILALIGIARLFFAFFRQH